MKQIILMTTLLMTAAVSAQPSVPWFTIDGGGQTFSTGGAFEIGGTIGQPDAGSPASPMAGGVFQIVGGFWAVSQVCFCPGDMNGDGKRDGADIQRFVACVLGGAGCSCADVDQANGVTLADVPVFVNGLLASNACP